MIRLYHCLTQIFSPPGYVVAADGSSRSKQKKQIRETEKEVKFHEVPLPYLLKSTETLKLKSSDDELLEVDISVAKISNVLARMFDDAQDGGDDDIPRVPVEHKILLMVFEYCRQQEEEKEVKENQVEKIRNLELVPENKKMNILFKLIIAAAYLEIEGLLKLAAEELKLLFADKTPQESKQILDENLAVSVRLKLKHSFPITQSTTLFSSKISPQNTS